MASAGASNNFDRVMATLQRKHGGERVHAAQLRNNAEYAAALHAKQGYFVFNPRHFKATVYRALKLLGESPQPFSGPNVKLVLEYACRQELDWLRSVTPNTKPPAPVNAAGRYISVAERAQMDDRHTHPGDWADVSGVLVSSYDYSVW